MTTGPAQQASTSPVGAHVDELVRQASGHIQARAYDDAEGLLLGALGVDPGHRAARYLLGMARFRRGDFAGADQAFAALVRANPADANAQYGLGISRARQGRVDEAAVALEAALAARPDFSEARRKLHELGFGGPAPSEPRPMSLAETLDARRAPLPDDETMAGGIQWAGRPSPLSLAPAGVVVLLVLLAPRVLLRFVESLPSGPLRAPPAALWRVMDALSLPAALVILTIAAAAWITARYTLRDRRLEIARGIVVRRHIVLWFHELERQPIVEQTLLDLLLGLGSIVLVTDALLDSRASRRSRLGRLVIRGLDAPRALALAGAIRQTMLLERRRMVQNFMSSR